MTIANANAFIIRGMKDTDLRRRLNAAADMSEIEAVLAAENLSFSAFDFDQAYHHQLTECQFEVAADQVKEFKLWWDMLNQAVSGSGGLSSGSCSSCSSCC